MGSMMHHAIVVTSSQHELLDLAHAKATEVFPWVSPMSPDGVNAVRSFFIPPDGSKDGWDDSNIGDTRRDDFVAWMNEHRYEDGSTSLDWVEIVYGETYNNLPSIDRHDGTGKRDFLVREKTKKAVTR